MIIGKPKRGRRVSIFISLLLAVIAGSLLVGVWDFLSTPAEEPGREILVTIPGGSSFVSASQLLVDAGVVRSLKGFVFLGKIKGISNSIQAGELMFDTGMTPNEVLEVLVRGKAVSYHVTIPEGYNIQMVAALLAEKGLGDADRILDLARDPEFARGLGVPADSLEGFLFPDTYSWPKGLSEKDILGRMVDKYSSVFTDAMRSRAQQMGMTEREVVTLASIIEKETGAPEERHREGDGRARGETAGLGGIPQSPEKRIQAADRPDGHLRPKGL
jgi:UPF0755 protein